MYRDKSEERMVTCYDEIGSHELRLIRECELNKHHKLWFCRDVENDDFSCFYVCEDNKIIYSSINKDAVVNLFNRILDRDGT